MKRRYTVLLLAGISLISGIASNFAVFFIVFYVLVGVLVGSLAWALLSLHGIHAVAERRPSRARVGDFAESDVTIRNSSVLPKLLVEIQDLAELPGQVTGRVVNLRPKQVVHWQAKAPLRKRGSYPLGPARAFSTDFFGIFRFERAFPGTQEIIVYPAIVDLPMFQLPQAEWTQLGAPRRRSQEVTPSASSVREYVQGDSLKRIHWPSSARTGKLMVKEFDTDIGNQVWIILDLHQDVQAGGDIENTEECGVTAAASIAAQCRAREWPVGLIAQGDREYFVAADRRASTEDRMLDMFAVAQAKGTKPVAEVLLEACTSIDPPATLVIITPSTNIEWVYAIRSLIGKQFQIAVVLIDVRSFGEDVNSQAALSELEEHGILTYVLHWGDALKDALNYKEALALEGLAPVPS